MSWRVTISEMKEKEITHNNNTEILTTEDDRTDDIFLVPQDKWKQFTCTFCTLKPYIPNGNSRDMI